MKRPTRSLCQSVPVASMCWAYLVTMLIQVLFVFVFVSFQLAETPLVTHTQTYIYSSARLLSDHDPWDLQRKEEFPDVLARD